MKGIVGVLVVAVAALAWLAWAGWTRTCADTCPTPHEQVVPTSTPQDFSAPPAPARIAKVAPPPVSPPVPLRAEADGPLVTVASAPDGTPMLRIPDTKALVDDTRYRALVHELLMDSTSVQVETRFRHQDFFRVLASRTGDVTSGDVACAEKFCVTSVSAIDENALRRYTAAMFGEPDARMTPAISYVVISVPRSHGVEVRIVFPTADDLRAFQVAGRGHARIIPVGHGPAPFP